MNKLKSKIFKLIEANSVDIEESSKNGIIAHNVDVDELVDDLFSLYGVVTRKTDIKNALLIIGISLIISGIILITQTLIGTIPIIVGLLMFGYGTGIKQK